MEKKLTIKEVYKSIAHQRSMLKQDWDNKEPSKFKDKWTEVINAYGWAMELLEKTEEINPTK